MKNVLIIGGGLAGLLTSIQLQKEGITCTLIEKKKFPFHRVCGEYVSNEVIPFLKALHVFPTEHNPVSISRFQLSSVSGKSTFLPLDLGGFGISRYTFDQHLVTQAKELGVAVLENTEVVATHFDGSRFQIETSTINLQADVVVGCFGKRSKLDTSLERSFIKKRSPYVGVKYHIHHDFPTDLVALHNFDGGYCGANAVENGKVNLCYLVNRETLKRSGSIPILEKNVLAKNPHLKSLFEQSDFLFDKPEVINEISFETKEPVHNHILMVGDAAGMITPLCGNGMAMAIHSSKIVSEKIVRFCTEPNYTRSQLEHDYTRQWQTTFSSRLWFGRHVQKLFGNEFTSSLAIQLALYVTPLAKAIVKGTHGKPFYYKNNPSLNL